MWSPINTKKTYKFSRNTSYWIAFLLSALFYAYQYIIRVAPSIMIKEISEKFGIDMSVMGQFAGFYYITYSLMHIPMGVLIDKYGPKTILSIGVLLSFSSLLFVLLSNNLTLLLIGRALSGLGSSVAILGSIKIIRFCFPKRFSQLLGLTAAIGVIGAMFAGYPLSISMTVFGFENSIIIICGSGIILSLLIYIFSPHIIKNGNCNQSLFAGLKEFIKNKEVIFIAIFAGLMVGPLEGFADIWGVEFLKNIFGFTSSKSAFYVSMIFFGICPGFFLIGYISNKYNSYYKPIIYCGLIMSIPFITIFYFGTMNLAISEILIMFAFFVVGLGSSYQIPAISKAALNVSNENSAVAASCTNGFIMFFGYFFHTIIGILLQTSEKYFSINNAFIISTSIVPICVLIGTIGFIYISKRKIKCNFDKK